VIDVLFTYQHKIREIESLCLLKLELERRQITSDFCCTFSLNRMNMFYHKPRVVIASAMYDDATLSFFVYEIAGFNKKVINLQWEQVLSQFDEANPNCYHNPKGYARYVTHLCWGESSRKRIMAAGVPDTSAIVTGAIHLDFLRPEFRSYFLSKQDVSALYKLNAEKNWCVFISSFTMPNMTDEEFAYQVSSFGDEAIEMKKISALSKKEILKWYEEALASHSDIEFIYRPHPDETQDHDLYILSQRFANFHVIGDMSVKQWILICEKILTWFSTSAAEIEFADKSFRILRPVEIPIQYDVSFYRNSKMISDRNEFIKYLHEENYASPLSQEILHCYYSNEENTPTYIKIADIIEKTLRTDEYDMPNHRPVMIVEVRQFIITVKRVISNLIIIIFGKVALKFPIIGYKIQNYYFEYERMNRDLPKNIASKIEIDEICNKLRPIINQK
jgi:surface carbohydrate biosynthesis protein